MPRAKVLALFPWALGREDPIRRRATAFCEALATTNEVVAISFVPATGERLERVLPSDIREIQIPFSPGFDALREKAVEKDGPSAEIEVLRFAPALTPAFANAVARHRADAAHTITIAAFAGIDGIGVGKAAMVLADRIEYFAARAAAGGKPLGELLERVAVRERAALRAAAAVIVPSKRDAQVVHALYGAVRTEVSAPTAAFANDAPICVLGNQRRARKSLSNLSARIVCVMAAPVDGVEAASTQRVFKIAALLPEVLFLIVGPLPGLSSGSMPENVQCTGSTTSEIADQIYACVDFAIDPGEDGESNGLRVIDYARRGIPVVATPAAARLLPAQAVICAQSGALHLAIRSLLDHPDQADLRAQIAAQAAGVATVSVS